MQFVDAEVIAEWYNFHLDAWSPRIRPQQCSANKQAVCMYRDSFINDLVNSECRRNYLDFHFVIFQNCLLCTCVWASALPIIAYMWRADSPVSILSFYHVSPGNPTRVTCWWEPLPIESSYWLTWIFSKGKFEVLDMCLGLPAWSHLVVCAWLQSSVSVRNTNI